MSDAKNFSVESPINPYYTDENIDLANAQIEHDLIRQAFESAGIEITQVSSPKNCQDGVYTANWALIRNKKAVLARLPNARKAEEVYAEKILTDLGYKVVCVPEDWHFSGQGDALPCGKYLLCGSGYRSDIRASEFAANYLGFERIQLHTKPEVDENGQPVINKASGWADSFFYDIDLAISILREDLIAYCPAAFDDESIAKIEALPMEKIKVSETEAKIGFAMNLVSTGETVIMTDQAPEYQAAIEAHGLKTITVSAPELRKGGGFIRCVSLAIA